MVELHGVPYADVLALIRFVAPYSGYPAAADALGVLPGIAESLGLDTDVPADPALDSVDAGRPDQPDALPVCSDAWMSDFLASRIGRSWSEERLSVRVALEGLDVRVVTEAEWREADPDGRFAENVNRPRDAEPFVEPPRRN